jgi:hypothetical protein
MNIKNILFNEVYKVQECFSDLHIEVFVSSILNLMNIHPFLFYVDRHINNIFDIDFHYPHTIHFVVRYLNQTIYISTEKFVLHGSFPRSLVGRFAQKTFR